MREADANATMRRGNNPSVTRRRGFALAAAAALALAACDEERPSTDQIAQRAMIGLSARDLSACLGEPARRRGVDHGIALWTYAGQLHGDGPGWAIGRNLNVAPFAPGGACAVRIALTNGRVSEVAYRQLDGRPLPLGQHCDFDALACVKRW